MIDVQAGQIHNGRLLTNMPWPEMLDLKGKAMKTCLPTYTGEKEAADKKAADLKARNEKQRAINLNKSGRKMLGLPISYEEGV